MKKKMQKGRQQNKTTPVRITREDAEKNLEEFIVRYSLQSVLSVAEVRERIYVASSDAREASNEYYGWMLGLLPTTEDVAVVNDAMQVFSDAWNTFPHQSLGGKSPMDMLEDELPFAVGRDSASYEKEMAGMVSELYRMVRARGVLALERIGGTTSEFEALEHAQRVSDEETSAKIIQTMFAVGKRTHRFGPEWFEWFMREYQGMDNHKPLPGHGDFVGSPFLFHLVQAAPLVQSNPMQLFALMTHAVHTHHDIDTLSESRALDPRVTSIMHHAYDWAMMTDPLRMSDLPTLSCAAVLLGVVGRIEEEISAVVTDARETEENAKVGNMKTPVYLKHVNYWLPALLCAAHDPHLYIIDAENAPDDWFLRLQRLAPHMEDHFDDDAEDEDVPPGSIPSPFIF